MREWQGLIWRPLLNVPKTDLRRLSRTLHFGYREDKTNRQTIYTRNRIRRQVIPLLTKINPQLQAVLLRNAENLAGLEEWLDDYLVEVRKVVKLRRQKQAISWRLPPFKQLYPYIQNELLLWAVEQLQSDRQGYKEIHLREMHKVIDAKNPTSFKQLPGKLFLIKAYDKISVSHFKPRICKP
jgi:tRNA(Ile)-lysidine synthase TilS/MesJ